MLTRQNVAAMLERLAAGTLSTEQLRTWATDQLAAGTPCDDEIDGDSICRILLTHIATHGPPEQSSLPALLELVNAPTCQHYMTLPLLQQLLNPR